MYYNVSSTSRMHAVVRPRHARPLRTPRPWRGHAGTTMPWYAQAIRPYIRPETPSPRLGLSTPQPLFGHATLGPYIRPGRGTAMLAPVHTAYARTHGCARGAYTERGARTALHTAVCMYTAKDPFTDAFRGPYTGREARAHGQRPRHFASASPPLNRYSLYRSLFAAALFALFAAALFALFAAALSASALFSAALFALSLFSYTRHHRQPNPLPLYNATLFAAALFAAAPPSSLSGSIRTPPPPCPAHLELEPAAGAAEGARRHGGGVHLTRPCHGQAPAGWLVRPNHSMVGATMPWLGQP
jgi:hypothetical protein